MSVFRPVLRPLYRSVFRAIYEGIGGSGPHFTFNGTNQYATFADWTPLGLPFEVKVSAVPLTVDGSFPVLWKAAASDPQAYFDPSGRPVVRYADVDGSTALNINGGVVAVGEAVSTVFTATPDGGEWVAGAADSRAEIPLSSSMSPVQTIGGRSSGNFFHGPVYQLHLTDNSPIQDTTANMGDGNRYGVLDEPIVLEGDFEISFDVIRQDRTGTSFWTPCGSDGDVDSSYIMLFDTGAGTPDTVRLRSTSTTSIWLDAMSDIAIGQHLSLRFVKVGGLVELFVDEVSKGVQGNDELFRLKQLYASEGASIAPANSALRNISIKDITEDREWFFPLTPHDIDATIGEQKFLVTEAAMFPSTFGLGGANVVSWSVDAADLATLVLDAGAITIPVAMIFGKATVPMSEGPANTWTVTVPGLYKYVVGGAELTFTEKGPIFTAKDIINTGATQGNYLNLPIFDTWVNEGNGALYGTIPALSFEGDFEIEFDWIRQETGAGFVNLLGDTIELLALYGTTTNDVLVRSTNNQTSTMSGALAGIAIGQHARLKFVRIGNIIWLYVDGVEKGTVSKVWESFSFSTIGLRGTSGDGQLPANSAFQNIKLHNLTTGEFVEYKLDEDALGVQTQIDATPDSISDGWSGSGGNWTFDVPPGTAFKTIQWTELTVGKQYRMKFTASGDLNSHVFFRPGDFADDVLIDTAGDYDFVFTAQGTNGLTRIANDDVTNITQFKILGIELFELDALGFKAYDINGAHTPALDGEWTAANKVFIPEYSNNGQWTPDTDWTAIPDNSRYYPMEEGAGNKFLCYDGNNKHTPINDATIIGYVDDIPWEPVSMLTVGDLAVGGGWFGYSSTSDTQTGEVFGSLNSRRIATVDETCTHFYAGSGVQCRIKFGGIQFANSLKVILSGTEGIFVWDVVGEDYLLNDAVMAQAIRDLLGSTVQLTVTIES